MANIRKDITTDSSVRDKYIAGVLRLKQEINPRSGLSTYDAFVVWHVRAMTTMTPPSQTSRNAAHRGPVFLPWHRYLLIVLEQQFQRVLNDTAFALPYWAWNRDGDLSVQQQRKSPIWQDNCMGGSGNPVTSGPFANPNADPTKFVIRVVSNSQGQLIKVNRGLARRIGADVANLPTSAQARQAVGFGDYDEADWSVGSTSTMRNVVEGWQLNPPAGMHNRVHVWVGGDMAPMSSPNDPVFFLNHCNVDRLWAAWQQKHPGAPYLPSDTAPVTLKFHRLSDTLFSVYPNPPKISDMIDVTDIYRYDTIADVS
ncbi:tyrosinase family protein [Mesorhizobium sp.]|uniref:tyrosinase family protein n=1 Tax=Mesorhizobium sp. TaxID=1871066 RepID=UPI0011F50AA2|nr:tyrosinase family protein [Mesorhizobium sp.]TIO79440.1 MAG: tyrosinase family protein [Mesorhizobium sp.]